MSDDNVIDLARYRALAHGKLTDEESAAWAGKIEDRARTLFTKNRREPFNGFCVAVFDDVKNRVCVLLGHHDESRVVAKYSIGKNDRLRPVRPTKRDDKLLARYRSGVFYPSR